MTVVSLLNQRGGVGRTTLAISLASAFAEMEISAAVLDADVQGSATYWANELRQVAALFPVIPLANEPDIGQFIAKISKDYEILIIDGPGVGRGLNRALVEASDLVLVPISNSVTDVLAAENVLQDAQDANVPARFVINRRMPGNTSKQEKAMRAWRKVPPLRPYVGNLDAFRKATNAGQTVLSDAPNSIAREQITNLAGEVLKQVRTLATNVAGKA
jgi:chromosome partitioning protein